MADEEPRGSGECDHLKPRLVGDAESLVVQFDITVGKAYANGSDLKAGLQAWQQNLVTYGNAQGFDTK